MTPALYSRAKDVFLEICDFPQEDRAVRLDARCAGDAELRSAVLQLLGGDASPLSLERAADGIRDRFDELLASPVPAESLPSIPNYHVIDSLGEGGFGVVFRAEQLAPVKRKVALKVIRAAMQTRQLLARFEVERQVLARMDHPGLARVLDAGLTSDGRPFFAMDLVDGEPLTRYCETRGLDLRARIQLLVRVCRAVHHAHQKGVIHRDLKPSNVLVTEVDGVPVPKVIDFGIARAVGDASPAGTVMTADGQFVGTPEYMSPEQATGRSDADVRSDVYSLGVLLYELVTGKPPFDFSAVGFSGLAEIQRVLGEVDPPRPSTRVDSARAQEIRTDLDWIVLKALDKDPARRYDSAQELTDELERSLAQLPIHARPPTLRYRFSKLARRRRGALIAASAIVLLAITGAGGTIAALIEARRAERDALAAATDARREAAVSAAISAFLNEDLLYAASPRGVSRDITVLSALERAAERLDGRFPDAPEVEVALRLTLGKTYRHLSDRSKAAEQLQRGIDLGGRALPRGDRFRLGSLYEMGLMLLDQRQPAKALTYFDEMLASDPQPGRSVLWTRAMQGKGRSYAIMGRPREALPILQEALDTRLIVAADDVNIPRLRALVGQAHLAIGDSERALAELTEAEAAARRIAGSESGDTLNAMHRLTMARIDLGRYAEGESLGRSLVESSRSVYGTDNTITFTYKTVFAQLLHGLRRHEEAETLLRPIVAARRASRSPLLTLSLLALADVVFERGRMGEAEQLYNEAIAAVPVDEARGDTAARSHLGLARTLAQQGRLDAARSHLTAGREMLDEEFPAQHWRRGEALVVEADLLIRDGRPHDAAPLLDDARSTFGQLAPSSLLLAELHAVEKAQGLAAAREALHRPRQ